MSKTIPEIIQILAEKLLNPDYCLDVLGGNSILLKEDKLDAKLKKVTILRANPPFATIKLDAFDPNRLSEYLNPTTAKINKGCDGIIFIEIEQKGYIFFCELKSLHPKMKDVKEQFESATCFVDYLESLLKTFEGTDLREFEKKYILFQKTNDKEKENLSNFSNKNIQPTWVRNYKVRIFPKESKEAESSFEEMLRKKIK